MSARSPMYITASERPSKAKMLHLPGPLYERIKTLAKDDRRRTSGEIIVLLEEAVAAREARK